MKTRGTATDIDKHVGQQIKNMRKQLSMTQTDLAEALDVTFQQIQKYEHGSNRISAGKLFEMANIMKIPISFFYNGLDNISDFSVADNAAQQTFSHSNEKDIQDLVEAYTSISDPKVKDKMLQLIKSMAES